MSQEDVREETTPRQVKLSELKRRLAAAKSWVTRTCNTLDTLLGDAELDIVAIEGTLKDVEEKLASFEAIQMQLELAVPESDMEDCIESAADYRDTKMKIVMRARRAVLEIEKSDSEASKSNSSLSHNVNLPKLDIGKFRGNVIEWRPFREKFDALIGDKDIPSVNKFTYLLSALEGEAKVVVQGLTVTGENYAIALRLLEERYGREEQVRFAHIQALLNLPQMPKGQKNVSALWSWRDSLLSHTRSLEVLGIKGETYGVFLTPIILSRLPNDVRMEWAREGEGRESDLDFLLEALNKEIRRIERSEAFKDNVSSSVSEEKKRKPFAPTATALHVASPATKGTCLFCDKSHSSHKCRKIRTVSDRKDKIRSLGLCFRCLGSHVARMCSKVCGECAGGHHITLCYSHAERPTPSSSGESPRASQSLQSSSTSQPSSSQSSSSVPQMTPTQSAKSRADSSSRQPETTDFQGHVRVDSVSQICGSNLHTTLPVVNVKVVCGNDEVFANVLLDSGSDRSYVTSSFVKKINPVFVQSDHVSYAVFGEKNKEIGLRNVYSINIEGAKQGMCNVHAVEVPIICAPMNRPTIPSSKLAEFQHLSLVETGVMENQALNIDILVGLDNYWKIVRGGVFFGSEGLVAQQTIFGWMINGSYTNVNALCSSTQMQLLCVHDIPELTMKSFWDLESIGISPIKGKNETNVEEHHVMSQFRKSVTFVNGRYEVAIPFNDKKGQLLENEVVAQKRLSSLTNKFKQNSELKERYDAVFVEYEELGFIEEVKPEHSISQPKYYMPHHPVVKEQSSSTKVRPVFDASAKGMNGFSLNDCVESGPSLIPSLLEILLRFRRWNVAITADIEKAFLQIQVREEDRNVHMFLWDVRNQIRTMRFTRVPFGNKCSPFLLNATIKHHLSTMPKSSVVTELLENLYVDDWLSGSDTEDEAQAMLQEAKMVMSKAGMNLTKWHSNKPCLGMMGTEQEVGCIKVLGVSWDGVSDNFQFCGTSLPPLEGLTCTKRGTLSLIARVFDPVGFLTPLIMYGKFIFQQLWKLGVGWDDEVPKELQGQFISWVKGLDSVTGLKIPRCIALGYRWEDASQKLEIHGFGDASEKGYGAVVYCRVPSSEGNYQVSLVMSKGKVAPMKKITLPRLELLGALLCARLVKLVVDSLKLSSRVTVFCWTDSMITLGWIKGESSRWKPFVANRVCEIQELTNPSCWNHCISEENPADMVSRGMTGVELVSCENWWQGPRWLTSGINSRETIQVDSICFPKEEKDVVCAVASNSRVSFNASEFDISRYSTIERSMKVMGWILRFISVMKNRIACNSSRLTLEELSAAKCKLILLAQAEVYFEEIQRVKAGLNIGQRSSLRKFNPFIGPDGLLRVGGRLARSDLQYEEKYPVILPKGHLALLLVRSQHVKHHHAGVDTMICMMRSAYWIFGLRRIAKQVKRECTRCQRQDALACDQPCGPLPALRVQQSPPFSVTGLDFAGPLYVSDFPGKKMYFLLFTCAVIRAVHLELVNSLSVDDCMLAIRRFCARRGIVSTFYSDNAKTFVGVSKSLVSVFGENAPDWRYIAPRSPWWGGWWERLVRSVKSGLRKSLGRSCLTRSELETSLIEIEACVNSRPLTFVGDEKESISPLTPSHFLTGRCAGFQGATANPVPVTSAAYRQRFEIVQERLNLFWSRWSNEYLRLLPAVVPHSKVQGDLKLGSLVLIKEDHVPKISWPLGRVIELHRGKDGIVRSVTLRTAKGVLKRSVQCLRDLELTSKIAESTQSETKGSNSQGDIPLEQPPEKEHIVTTRYGRVVKPRMK